MFLGYGDAYGVTMSDKEITKIFNSIDTDSSGTIDYTEFISASLDRNKLLNK